MTNSKLVCPHCGASRKKTQSRCAYCGSELEVEEPPKPTLEEKTERFMENIFDNYAEPVLSDLPRIIVMILGIVLIVAGLGLMFLGFRLGFVFPESSVRIVLMVLGGITLLIGLILLIRMLSKKNKG